jgi:hypothetical protein
MSDSSESGATHRLRVAQKECRAQPGVHVSAGVVLGSVPKANSCEIWRSPNKKSHRQSHQLQRMRHWGTYGMPDTVQPHVTSSRADGVRDNNRGKAPMGLLRVVTLVAPARQSVSFVWVFLRSGDCRAPAANHHGPVVRRIVRTLTSLTPPYCDPRRHETTSWYQGTPAPAPGNRG